MSEALLSITGFYTWKYSSLLVKEYQCIRILSELSTKLLPNCYEHARDQGTLGSVAGCRHSRTPGRKGLAISLSVGDGRQ
jgi:hypothetical protein